MADKQPGNLTDDFYYELFDLVAFLFVDAVTNQMNISKLAVLGLIVLTSLANAEKTEEPSLTRIQKILTANKMVDLTHEFEKGIPHWRFCRHSS